MSSTTASTTATAGKAGPYDPKNMRFRHLGPAGIKVALFSLGGWLTYGGTVDQAKTTEIMKLAWELGINTFDTAEVYAAGESERVMGQAIRDLGLPREDLVLTTKIFFGTGGKTPNSRGLSRKHLVEGTDASLKRAGLTYWDVIHAHRPDASVNMEEIVRAFNHLIDTDRCFYWATSEWSAQQVQEAHTVAQRLGLVGPVADQPQYNLFHRERVEKEYEYLYRAPYHLGLTTWSPLASGLLTGKYNDGIPSDSRYATNASFFQSSIDKLKSAEGQAKIAQVRKLTAVAERLGTTPTVLSLAWCAANPNVSTVILGATKPEQLKENLKALDVIDKLTPEVMKEIDAIFENKPEENPKFGRL